MNTGSILTLTDKLREPTTRAGWLRSRVAQRRAFCGLLLVGDGLMLILAFYLAYWLRFDLGFTLAPGVVPGSQFYSAMFSVLFCLWLGLFGIFGLYDFRYLLEGTVEFKKVFKVWESKLESCK